MEKEVILSDTYESSVKPNPPMQPNIGHVDKVQQGSQLKRLQQAKIVRPSPETIDVTDSLDTTIYDSHMPEYP